jgi:hypothetical protein
MQEINFIWIKTENSRIKIHLTFDVSSIKKIDIYYFKEVIDLKCSNESNKIKENL